jgi:hypothetical protein
VDVINLFCFKVVSSTKTVFITMNVGYYFARRRKMISDGCPRCLKLTKVTKEMYGVGDRKFTLYLCLNCHRELQELVEVRQLPENEYWAIAKKWLRGEHPYVF